MSKNNLSQQKQVSVATAMNHGIYLGKIEKMGSDLEYKINVNKFLVAQGLPEKHETWCYAVRNGVKK